MLTAIAGWLFLLRVMSVCGRGISRGLHDRSATQPFLDIHRCTWGRPGPVELGVFWDVVSPHITC